MPFPSPQHAGHTFLGYRGVSNAHFYVGDAKSIRYTPPPPAVAGDVQLGQGVYVTDNPRTAMEYAQDSAWNYYCNQFRDKNVEDDVARKVFEGQEWTKWGRVHAVFLPTNKYSSEKAVMADFTHVNIDKMGDFVRSNMMSFRNQNKSKIYGIKTQLYDRDTQTIVYPPHTRPLYMKDVTDAVWQYHK